MTSLLLPWISAAYVLLVACNYIPPKNMPIKTKSILENSRCEWEISMIPSTPTPNKKPSKTSWLKKRLHYCWWFRNPANHLGCINLLVRKWDNLPTNWFYRRISEPSTVSLIYSDELLNKQPEWSSSFYVKKISRFKRKNMSTSDPVILDPDVVGHIFVMEYIVNWKRDISPH